MSELYPNISPYQTHEVEVSDLHTLYVEESGNPDGIPVVYLHGGPGGGSNADYRRIFDPNTYRIVQFDQRGCGKSTPYAELKDNDTWLLVKDIEHIRELLGIDSWVVAGGSWGATLALVYGIKHSDRVKGLILRSVFLGRDEDIRWLYYPRQGASQVYPDYYRDFYKPLDDDPNQEDLLGSYHALLTSDNELQRLAAAQTWATWEARISTVRLSNNIDRKVHNPHFSLGISRIECHYFLHQCFMQSNYILDNVSSIGQIPGYIIHGRYDMVCKLEGAYKLDKAWENAKLQIIPEAGHSMSEPGMGHALVKAAHEMAHFVAQQQ